MSALSPKADITPVSPSSNSRGLLLSNNINAIKNQPARVVQFSLPYSEPNTARPLLRFAAVQFFKRVQHTTSLAPKGRFIATEAIEREIGQIG